MTCDKAGYAQAACGLGLGVPVSSANRADAVACGKKAIGEASSCGGESAAYDGESVAKATTRSRGSAACDEKPEACDADATSCGEGARGAFVTFEGGEGAGKSTHIAILARALEACGREVVRLREPGGTAIGEKLRHVVLSPESSEMADECELLIYEAARAQLVAQVIAPALSRGAAVLCDRFCDSTVAYQAAGRSLDAGFVRRVNEFACQGVSPDLTVLMDAGDARAGLARAIARDGGPDRLEAAGGDFHERVAAAFSELAAAEPDRVRVVRSDASKSATARAVFSACAPVFGELAAFLADDAFFAALDEGSDPDCAGAEAREGAAPASAAFPCAAAPSHGARGGR